MDKELIQTALWYCRQSSDFLRNTTAEKFVKDGYDRFSLEADRLAPATMRLCHETDKVQIMTQFVFSFVAASWYAGKAIYDFDKDFLRNLMATEDAPIYEAILRRLPYTDYLIPLPEGTGYDGMFVHIEFDKAEDRNDILFLVCPFVGSAKESEVGFRQIPLWCKDGSNLAQAHEETAKRAQYPITEEDKELDKTLLKLAVYTAYYLSSKNAVVRDVSPAKAKRPKMRDAKGREKPVKIQVYEAGYRVGESFEAQMRRRNTPAKATNTPAGVGGSKTPHMRRAHWHHYWVGEGRTTLEVRWIEPTFVGNPDRAVAVVRKVSGRDEKGM